MHRTLRRVTLLAALATVLVAPGAFAQNTVASVEGHPFVGAWLVDTNTSYDTEPPARLIVHPDGTLLQVDQTTVAVGVWQPTDDNTAGLTISAQVDVGEGKIATITLRAEVTLDPAGDAWTAEATVQRVDPAGTDSGQMGPIPAAATRIVVEPMAPTATPGA